jgi:FkbM family methyltransferase
MTLSNVHTNLNENLSAITAKFNQLYGRILNPAIGDHTLGFNRNQMLCLINMNGDWLWLPSDLLKFLWHTLVTDNPLPAPHFLAETPHYIWTRERLHPGDTVLDCGANIGIFTTMMAERVGPKGQVHSFEPDPVICEDLKRVLHVNAFNWVTVNQMALSNTEGEALFCKVTELDVRRESSHLSVTGYSPEKTNTQEFSVPTTTLDAYVEKNGIFPKLIKIDVEGAEFLVLEGGRRCIEQHRPLLVIEVHADNSGIFDHRRLKQFFQQNGYANSYDGDKTYYGVYNPHAVNSTSISDNPLGKFNGELESIKPTLIAVMREQAASGQFDTARIICSILKNAYCDGWEHLCGIGHNPEFFKVAEAIGLHVLPVHFYSPVASSEQISRYTPDKYTLNGLDIDFPRQIALLKDLSGYLGEIWGHNVSRSLSDTITSSAFTPFDISTYYCMIRHMKPKQVLEVGGGSSSLVARAALMQNDEPARLTVIEPFPTPQFKNSGIADQLIAEPVQAVSNDYFDTLAAGDILFIDSTHVCSPGSDVTHLYLNILPRLRKGVLVHIHDIWLPNDGPLDWRLNKQILWNEQYLLHTFLLFNSDFEVILSANYPEVKDNEPLKDIYRHHDDLLNGASGSFWLRRKDG